MKKLPVQMGELIYAIEDTSYMANHYLDTLVQHVAMAWWQWQPSLAALSGLGAQATKTETEEV